MGNEGSTIAQYLNVGKNLPQLLNESEPSIGLSSTRVNVSGDNLICAFTRDNINDEQLGYFTLKLDTPTYFVVAWGNHDEQSSNCLFSQINQIKSYLFMCV